jgi:hypothetical protein
MNHHLRKMQMWFVVFTLSNIVPSTIIMKKCRNLFYPCKIITFVSQMLVKRYER